ncbi:alpha/beta hydrolase [Paracnuella aquatica]|uniref:alpha/beta hydrolase n=1 Tax=Paracnuella aquatica TaxID=2268757 RepID=UPI000DEF826C|nr:alpha/beta hydrolase family protein [Paracnuella aquatica]RPD48837.1 esterase family protein [Paracnuella aquatica]
MRKHYFFLSAVFTLLTLLASGQPMGKIVDQNTVASKLMKRPVNYAVYLPPGYETAQRSYPVVYLLHGYTDDHNAWVQFGEVGRLADKAIADGTIPPMVIIMPDADSSWYINAYDGKESYEDFFVQEFIPTIEKSYRIKAEKRYRGIAGLSMGGYGTLIYSLKYPHLFTAAAPLSAAVFDDAAMKGMPEATWERTFAQLYGRGLKGDSRMNDAWKKNSILNIVATTPADSLKKVRYWIDCGDDDFLIKGNCLLKIALTEKGVPHEFRIRDGAHTWTYWRTGLIDALAFIGDGFRQK